MKPSQLRVRYWRIMWFFAGATADFIFWELLLSRMGFRSLVRKSRSQRYRRVAAKFRSLAIRMGGVMIKVGQFLSSRLDVLPPEITLELAGLQDEVPAEQFEDIRRLAEAELGGALGDLFESFEQEPIAAASLGQVHRAELKRDLTGRGFSRVVVKVQRPDINRLIEVDLSALRRFGNWLQHYQPVARRVNVPNLVEEFSAITRAEIDYLAEGSNAEQFARNFEGIERVHVPRVIWERTTRRVLTLEDVFAIKITDYDAITAAGIDRAEVAEELLDAYLKQIFEDGFFHADPHPGNLFVTPIKTADDRVDWKLTFVDFGMTGHVPENLRQGLRELLISVGTQDAARLVRAYQTLDVLLPGANLKLIEQAEAELFELFWGKSMSELRQIHHAEMFRFAEKFRELMYELPFQLPQNLLMLGRCVAILSGMCTGLNKDFNLWMKLAPYASKLMAKETGSNWRFWLEEIGNLLKDLAALPGQVNRLAGQMARGDLSVQVSGMQQQFTGIQTALIRLRWGVVFTGLLLGGILLGQGSEPVSTLLYFAAAAAFLLMMFGGRGGPRRFHP